MNKGQKKVDFGELFYSLMFHLPSICTLYATLNIHFTQKYFTKEENDKWAHFVVSLIMGILVNITMIQTSIIDPGIIPKLVLA